MGEFTLEPAPKLPRPQGRPSDATRQAVKLYQLIQRVPAESKEAWRRGAILDAILKDLTPQEMANYYAALAKLRADGP